MEHPLINDVNDLTLEQLQDRISDLTKKLGWAQRSGNANLVNQISLALNTFRSKYQEKQQAAWAAANRNGPDYSDRIDIS